MHILGLLLLVCLTWPCQNSALRVFKVHFINDGVIQSYLCMKNECNYVQVMIISVKVNTILIEISSLSKDYVNLMNYNYCKFKKNCLKSHNDRCENVVFYSPIYAYLLNIRMILGDDYTF